MGTIHFRLPEDLSIDTQALDSVYLMGIEQVPWVSRVSVSSGILSLERNSSESACLYINLILENTGELVLSTATLPERAEPYFLALELARGTVDRINAQLFLWQEGGLEVTPELAAKCSELNDRLAGLVFGYARLQVETESATDHEAPGDGDEGGVGPTNAGSVSERQIGFAESAPESPEKVTRLQKLDSECAVLLRNAVERIHELAAEFSDYVLALRIAHDGGLRSLLGVILSGERLEDIDQRAPAWASFIACPIQDLNESVSENSWEATQAMCSKLSAGARLLSVGPLLDYAARSLPTWLQSDDTFELQRQIASNYAQSFAREFGSSPQLVYVAAGINGIATRNLTYPQQLQLTVDMLEGLEYVRSDIKTLVSFDQPWGERLGFGAGGTHPLHIADALLRHGLQITSFGLEINLSYWLQGSFCRDPFRWVDLIDVWSQFGLPLFIILSAPNQCLPDQESGSPLRLDQLFRDKRVRGRMTQPQLLQHLQTVIEVLLCKPIVNGVVWRQWQDDSEMRFIGSGLLSEDGCRKPAWDLFQAISDRLEQLDRLER